MNTATEKITESFGKLPYFYVSNLKILDIPPYYLKIAVNRMFKKGLLFRLKRQCYVSKSYIDMIKSENRYNDYLEFISSKIYEPAYLSLEYVLYENNILTESPRKFTLVTKNKTQRLINGFGSFSYYKVKDGLFGGYKTEKRGNFFISKASPGKALFDFLYLRKSVITDKSALEALRLDVSGLGKSERGIFSGYAAEAGAGMKKIAGWLL